MEKKKIILLGTAGVIGYMILSRGTSAQTGGGGGFGGFPQIFSFGTGEVTAPLKTSDTQIPALPDVNIYESSLAPAPTDTKKDAKKDRIAEAYGGAKPPSTMREIQALWIPELFGGEGQFPAPTKKETNLDRLRGIRGVLGLNI